MSKNPIPKGQTIQEYVKEKGSALPRLSEIYREKGNEGWTGDELGRRSVQELLNKFRVHTTKVRLYPSQAAFKRNLALLDEEERKKYELYYFFVRPWIRSRLTVAILKTNSAQLQLSRIFRAAQLKVYEKKIHGLAEKRYDDALEKLKADMDASAAPLIKMFENFRLNFRTACDFLNSYNFVLREIQACWGFERLGDITIDLKPIEKTVDTINASFSELRKSGEDPQLFRQLEFPTAAAIEEDFPTTDYIVDASIFLDRDHDPLSHLKGNE